MNDEKNKKNSSGNLCEGPLLKKTIFYTLPIICTGLLQLLFNAADLVVVGRFCGSVSVAAVGATNSIINLIVNLFIGLSVGAGVSVAHALGAEHHQSVRQTVHTAIPTAIISGIALTVIGIALTTPMLNLMGTPDNVINLSATYMKIYFAGMTFSMVYNYGAAILRAAGDSKSPLIYLTLAGILNVVLNVFFVTVFHMDVAGVAFATSLSQVLSAVLVVRALIKRTDACHLRLSKMHIYRNPLLKMIVIGVPAGIQGSMFSISNVIIQSSINSFGSVVMSGNATAGNIEGFVYMAMNSYHQTALNFIGQNIGARKFDRVKKIIWICLLSVFITGGVLGSLAYLFGESLLSIYITDSQEAINYGLIRLQFICLPYFMCGLMDVSTGILRGMGSSITPMFITVIGVCGLRILWIFTIFQMPQFHTLEYLYLSYPITWGLTFVVQLVVGLLILTRKIRFSDRNENTIF